MSVEDVKNYKKERRKIDKALNVKPIDCPDADDGEVDTLVDMMVISEIEQEEKYHPDVRDQNYIAGLKAGLVSKSLKELLK